MVAIKIIIINLNEFHLKLFISRGIWKEVRQNRGPLGMKQYYLKHQQILKT